ncbi:putative rhamnogalacturonate lyase C [Pseudocercospora fuligena]|uniref:Putative rhamnogalacturonate lyase C n=1 Tax=Pseudocercospora fuligena TaxID=685502 RepID=A0A8H6RHW8_9PEZI|nr:putative rhamnogalacturonate lyase C [Pseudocercospora fuligena]
MGTQLSWLASQPHLQKVVIAGNHDVLFDQQFLDTHQDRFPVSPGNAKENLDFGDIVYLENSSTTLTFPFHGDRKLKIYGSPLTPKSFDSAFHYPKDHDAWEGQDRSDIDILITHGPPWGHLDGNLRYGCQYLAHAVSQWRPRLHVFGHIHVGYGRELVRYDSARRNYEDVQRGWAGWEAVASMATSVAWSNVRRRLTNRRDQVTEHINAAVVDQHGSLVNEAMVTYV